MWLLPSRARPENLRRFFEAFRATGGSTPGMVLVDELDAAQHRDAYDALELPLGWTLRLTEHPTQGAKIREIWDEVKDCAWLGLIGDDNIPITPGWDRRLIEKLNGWNLVSCNDMWLAPRRVGNCWIMSGQLVRAVGYIFPPGMEHLFVDDVWEAIGNAGACWRCEMDVFVKHAHVMKGDAPVDQTHRETYGDGFRIGHFAPDRSHGRWVPDEAAYKAWRETELPRIEGLLAHLRPAPDAAHEARMARATARKLLIVTPIHGDTAWQYTLSMVATVQALSRMGVTHDLRAIIGNSNLPRARNELAAFFLSLEWDDCLLVDSDMGWTVNDVLRLAASDKEVIGGVGRKKVDKPLTDGSIWCVRLIPGQKEFHTDEMGAIKVAGVGTGFLKISRSAFVKLVEAHPDWKRHGRDDMKAEERRWYYKFFRFPDDEHDTGEDYFFCNAWRELGGEVWIDPSIRLTHAGNHGFTGCFGEFLEWAETQKPAQKPEPEQRQAAE